MDVVELVKLKWKFWFEKLHSDKEHQAQPDVNVLRQWFEAKEVAIEAKDLSKEREEKMEEEVLTPVLESFWIGTIGPDSPVGEGSGLTEVKDKVPLLFCYCLYNNWGKVS